MEHRVKHLAVILDGNRRWAKRRGLPVHKGHEAGVLALERLVRLCKKRGIDVLTVFGFSTENWGRSRGEVAALVKVMEMAVNRYAETLDREGVGLRLIGRPKDFPKSLASLLDKAVHKLSRHKSPILNIAISYGGRDEICLLYTSPSPRD